MASAFTNLAGAITAVSTLIQCSRRLDKEQWVLAEVLAERRREFQIAIEIVDQIPIAPRGKLQFLVPLART